MHTTTSGLGGSLPPCLPSIRNHSLSLPLGHGGWSHEEERGGEGSLPVIETRAVSPCLLFPPRARRRERRRSDQKRRPINTVDPPRPSYSTVVVGPSRMDQKVGRQEFLPPPTPGGWTFANLNNVGIALFASRCALLLLCCPSGEKRMAVEAARLGDEGEEGIGLVVVKTSKWQKGTPRICCPGCTIPTWPSLERAAL